MSSFDPNKITLFARTDSRGKNVAFGIKAKDRQRHMYVIGKTGMGKSTLLENMAVQDIQNGEGMAFIDPHGSAAETLLNYIPEDRINDVVYFAPFDTEYPVSFNIMEDVGPEKRHLVVSGLMSVFKKIWVDAWSARMEYILSNTLLALLEYPDSTLLGVNRMLSDKHYRQKVIDNVQDPSVKAFWVDEFLKYNERYMQEAGDAIKNKIGQFTANPVIRNIIGQPRSSFDIRKIMDEKKIIIMNLSKGLIGETNANLLGSMLTTRIYLAAMSRADLSPEKMKEAPNFYFYVDEFQSFANATFANILSEARKYHLNLTIAHQYIEQMEEEVRNAVFGNVGTVISFRVGPFDAEILETIFTPQFLATDIVNLSFAQIYLTLMIDGIGSQPFSATTLPPIELPPVSCKDMAIHASRKQFAKKRAEVEVEILKFHEPVIAPRLERKDLREEEGRSKAKFEYRDQKNTFQQKREEGGKKFDRKLTQGRYTQSPDQPKSTSDKKNPENSELHIQQPHEDRHIQQPSGQAGEHIQAEEKDMIPKIRQEYSRTALNMRENNSVIDFERPTLLEKENVRTTPVIEKRSDVEDLRAVLARVADKERGTLSEKKPHAQQKSKEALFKASHADLRKLVSNIQRMQGSPKRESTGGLPQLQHEAGILKEGKDDDSTRDERRKKVFDSGSTAQSTLPVSFMPRFEKQKQDTNDYSERKKEETNKQRPRITPRELERMMRVTTSDKPPF